MTTATPLPLQLDARQIAFFDTFGFLKLPGLFADEIADITAAFDEVFIQQREEIFVNHSVLHDDEERLIMMKILERTPKLSWLLDDRRVQGVAASLMRRPYEFADSDASIFSCETAWHADTFGAPMDRLHVKLSLYLDPLTAENGAIRLIPGTNHHSETFAKLVRRQLAEGASVPDVFGVEGSEVPSWTLESEPGDLVVWNFRTVHASYNGNVGRRLMSISFREEDPGSS